MTVERSADVAFQAASDLTVGESFGAAAGGVLTGGGVVAQACADDDVDSAVELAIAGPGEAVAGGVAG